MAYREYSKDNWQNVWLGRWVPRLPEGENEGKKTRPVIWTLSYKYLPNDGSNGDEKKWYIARELEHD